MTYDNPDRSHVPLYRNQRSQRNLIDIHVVERHAVERQQLLGKFVFNFELTQADFPDNRMGFPWSFAARNKTFSTCDTGENLISNSPRTVFKVFVSFGKVM